MNNITGTEVQLHLFDDSFINSGAHLYLHCFKSIPNLSFVHSIDGERAFDGFMEKYSELVQSNYAYNMYGEDEKFEFNETYLVLKNGCVLEFYTGYCKIFYPAEQGEFVKEIAAFAGSFREKERKRALEINLIVRNGSYLDLRSMEVKATELDIALFYEDDFKKTDEIIQKRLSNKNDKGIVLLHGLPGTGKTTYLRYLVGKMEKRILFLSPNVAGNLVDPEFVQLLIENPDSVLVIEDAENIIMDRKLNANSSVSNLLNISDGLLADFLNVQIICTFNNALTLVDSALMRKGRLIAKYEFGKLSVAKAQRLSEHMGFDTLITKPMTLAEIANQHEEEQPKQVQVIGFRSNALNN